MEGLSGLEALGRGILTAEGGLVTFGVFGLNLIGGEGGTPFRGALTYSGFL